MRQRYVKDTIIQLLYDATNLANDYWWDSEEIAEMNKSINQLKETLEKSKSNYYDKVMIMETE